MTTVAQIEDSIRALPLPKFLELLEWMDERHLDILKSEDRYESPELEAEMLKALDSPRRALNDELLDSIRSNWPSKKAMSKV